MGGGDTGDLVQELGETYYIYIEPKSEELEGTREGGRIQLSGMDYYFCVNHNCMGMNTETVAPSLNIIINDACIYCLCIHA